MHTFAECKTDISTMITVTSGPDSHMMSKLDSPNTWRWNLFEVSTESSSLVLVINDTKLLMPCV